MSQSVVAQAVSHLPGMNRLRKGNVSESGASGEPLPQSATSGPPLSDASAKQVRTGQMICAASVPSRTVPVSANAGQHSHQVSCNPS